MEENNKPENKKKGMTLEQRGLYLDPATGQIKSKNPKPKPSRKKKPLYSDGPINFGEVLTNLSGSQKERMINYVLDQAMDPTNPKSASFLQFILKHGTKSAKDAEEVKGTGKASIQNAMLLLARALGIQPKPFDLIPGSSTEGTPPGPTPDAVAPRDGANAPTEGESV